MQRHVLVLLGLVLPLLIVVLITIVMLAEVNNPQDVIIGEFRFIWLIRMIGAYVAAIAALALLVWGIVGTTSARILALAFPLFAGLLVFQVHWATAVSFAAILIATLANDTFVSIRTSRLGSDSTSPTK